MITLFNATMLAALITTVSLVSPVTDQAQVDCTDLCQRAYEATTSAGDCDSWFISVVNEPDSQDGTCQCHGSVCEWGTKSCKMSARLEVVSNGRWIWQKARCDPLDPLGPWIYYCQQIGQPGGGGWWTTYHKCFGCGCDASIMFGGYTQACGAVNRLNECNSPPDQPPAGVMCAHVYVKMFCSDCDGGKC